MRELLIFRHQLFKTSEPFIAQQAEQLTSFRPIYVGRTRLGPPPAGSNFRTLDSLPGHGSSVRQAWQILTRDPRPYAQLLGDLRPSLIHAHFGVEGVYALPLARHLGVPLVTTFHGFDATTSRRALFRSRSPSWMQYALRRRELARSGDLFLCVSEYIRDRVLALGFPADRTRVHYIGIDAAGVRRRDHQEETPTILHVARLVEKKGTQYLIRAFAKIAVDWPETELVIIGAGPLHSHLRGLAEGLGVGRRVRFLGAMSHADVMAWMAMASMLVLPSVHASTGDAEGLGMVLLEAAATGVPVIGTRHGGIPEAIVDGRTGHLVEERDSDELADGMAALLSDAGRRAAMGNNARAMVEESFDSRVQALKLEAFYETTLT